MRSKKIPILAVLLYSSLLSAQDFQAIIKNELARKGFTEFDSSLCTKTIHVQVSGSSAEVFSSSAHFVNKVDSEHYNVEFLGAPSVWYKIEAESSRELNFSLLPMNMQNINFVLYKIQNYTRNSCPKADQLLISRAVLTESSDLLRGVGLTGESTADYNDSKNLNSILYATPYHKSVFLEAHDVYFLNVLVRDQDLSHTLSIANTTITVGAKKIVEPEFKKTNLKSFLNKPKNTDNTVSQDSSALVNTAELASFEPLKEPSLVVKNNYDHFLYEPEQELGAPIVVEESKKSKKKAALSEADVFAMENPKSAKASSESTYSPHNINGKLLYSDGSPASNIAVYATDVTIQTDHRMTGVKTSADGSFSIPVIAQHIFISADADDAKKGNKTPLKMTGTIPSTKKNIEIYSAKIQGEGFEINNVTLVAYDDQASVQIVGGQTKEGAPKTNVSSNMDIKTSTSAVSGAFTYKIQVGAYKRSRSFKRSKFEDYGVISSYNLGDGLVRYTVGAYSSIDEAEKLKQTMINEGHTGVFIVAFRNGIRTSFR